MNQGFDGAGWPNVGIKCKVRQIKKLLMHYGYLPNSGLEIKVLLGYLLLELGMSLQPLHGSYKQYEQWVTSSWLELFKESTCAGHHNLV